MKISIFARKELKVFAKSFNKRERERERERERKRERKRKRERERERGGRLPTSNWQFLNIFVPGESHRFHRGL